MPTSTLVTMETGSYSWGVAHAEGSGPIHLHFAPKELLRQGHRRAVPVVEGIRAGPRTRTAYV
ncbi:hypothetical protein GCM10018952_14380 [Streptosporangium vulgare]